MHGLGMKEIGLVLIGVLLGAITAAGLYSGGERYDLIASPDGSVVHKIDRRTGDVWIKNSYVEIDPAGQPVTIWYWEKLTLDKPGAKSIAQNLQENADQVRAEAEEALGQDFDLAAFHDVVLEAGAVPLPILRTRVKAWQNEVAGNAGAR